MAVTLFLLALARLPACCEEEAADLNFGAKTQTNAMYRSLMCPGLGQIFNGSKTKGYILIGAESAAILGTVALFVQANQKYDDYSNAGIISGPLYDDYQKAYNTAVLGIGLCAAIWIYGAADAYFSSPYKKSAQIKEESFDWKLGLTANSGLSAVCRYKF